MSWCLHVSGINDSLIIISGSYSRGTGWSDGTSLPSKPSFALGDWGSQQLQTIRCCLQRVQC